MFKTKNEHRGMEVTHSTMFTHLEGHKTHLIKNDYSKSSVDGYYDKNKRLLTYLEEVGIFAPEDLTNEVVEVVESWMLDRGLNSKSRQMYICALKSFIGYLYDHEYILFDVGKKFTYPKEDKKYREIPSKEDVQNLIQVASEAPKQGLKYYVLISLLYYTGCRAGEMAQVCVSDINFRQRSIFIVGKGGHERYVYFPEAVCQKLKQYVGTLERDRLFTYSPRQLPNVVTKICKRAGLEQSGSHWLRYSISTHLYEDGANVRLIQVMLGHRTVESTYCYINPSLSYLRGIHQKYHPFQNGFL